MIVIGGVVDMTVKGVRKAGSFAMGMTATGLLRFVLNRDPGEGDRVVG